MSDWTPERAATVGRRLAGRVQRSLASHRDYRTLRREELRWVGVGLGVREAALTATDQARTLMVTLDAGAALPWAAPATAQEVLVVSGELQATGADGSSRLMPCGYALRGAADAGSLVAVGPARLYLRETRCPSMRRRGGACLGAGSRRCLSARAGGTPPSPAWR
jgi:hypothetical protein